MAPRRRAALPPFALRPIRPADAPLLARQRAALFRDMHEFSAAAVRRHGRSFRPWLLRELRAGRLVGRVAESSSGVPIGGGLLWFQPRHPSPRFPQMEQPYLLSVYTEPAHRGRGVATAVVRALVEVARRRGYARVDLHATEMGRSLYAKLGFRPTNQMRLALGAGRPARRSRSGDELRAAFRGRRPRRPGRRRRRPAPHRARSVRRTRTARGASFRARRRRTGRRGARR